tara:strand:- start:386 stop:676 length:291 start_codon:yes stop_codon:yes gene_type:complete
MKNKMYLQILLGAIVGLLSPAITAYLIYKFKYNYISVDMLKISKALLVPLLQYGALTNLAWFFLLNYFKRTYLQRGIIFGTIFIAMYIIYLKFFGH